MKKLTLRIAHIHVEDRHNKGDRAIVLAVQEQLRAAFPGCRLQDFPMEVLRDGGEADLKQLNRADLIIIGGGGIFYSYFLPYNQDFIAQIEAPIAIYGAGYIREIGSRPLDRRSARSVAFLVKRAARIGVRDYNTKKFLEAEGVPASHIKVIGDPAACLSEELPAGSLGLLAKRRPGAVRIGLNLNYSGWLGFGKWREDILTAYRSTAQYFAHELGSRAGGRAELYYLQHHPGEKNIYPALELPGLRVVNLAPRQQKWVYGQLDLVIGMMLHVGVMSFGAGTPQVSVAYDLRNYSFAEYIKHKELVINLEDLKKGALQRTALRVYSKQDYYRARFRAKREQIAKLQASFLQGLSRLKRRA